MTASAATPRTAATRSRCTRTPSSAPDDNTLCQGCHDALSGGSYATNNLYLGTSHGSKTSMVWPGPTPPARIEPDAATKRVNCHDPHGWTDALGAIPSLPLQREEGTCLACHDGSPATINVNTDIRKTYRHPATDYNGRHTGPKESLATDFATTPINRRHPSARTATTRTSRAGREFRPTGVAAPRTISASAASR